MKLGALRNLHRQVIQGLRRSIVSGEVEAGKSLPRGEILTERMLVEMREIIEPAAAAMAARRRSPEQLTALGAAYRAMAAAKDLDDWTVADLAFHECMLRATNNELPRKELDFPPTCAVFYKSNLRNARRHPQSERCHLRPSSCPTALQ